jgi:excisionase family DNA binding protein
MAEQPPPLTPEEVAERWQVPPLRVLKLCKTRRLRHFKIGKGVYRIPVDAIPEYEARCVSSSTEDGGMPSGEMEELLSVEHYAPKIVMQR